MDNVHEESVINLSILNLPCIMYLQPTLRLMLFDSSLLGRSELRVQSLALDCLDIRVTADEFL